MDIEEEVASNVSANLGGPQADNNANINGADFPMQVKDMIKRRVYNGLKGYGSYAYGHNDGGFGDAGGSDGGGGE